MPETPFKIYPRGFLGRVLEGRVEKTTKSYETIRGFQDLKALVMRDPNSVDHSNPDIEALYWQFVNRSVPTTSFEFRQKVLIVALAAFGTQMFDFWYQMQLRSPVCGDMHRRFLDDTLRFIREGRREMALETWNVLVTAEDSGDHSGKLSEYANEFFGFSSNGISRYEQNRKLTEVIQSWCSRPNGLEDMLFTLHILFGNQ